MKYINSRCFVLSVLSLPVLLSGCNGSVVVAFNGFDDPIDFRDCSELPTRYSFTESVDNGAPVEFSVVKQWNRTARELAVTTTRDDGDRSVVEFQYASVASLKDEIDTFGLIQFDDAIEALDEEDTSGVIENNFDSEGFLIRERVNRTGKLDSSVITTEFSSEILWQNHQSSGRPIEGLYEFTRKEGGVILDECENIAIENQYNNSQRTLILSRNRTNDTRCEDDDGDYEYRESIERFTFNDFGHLTRQEQWLAPAQGSAPDMDSTPNIIINFTYNYDESIDICV